MIKTLRFLIIAMSLLISIVLCGCGKKQANIDDSVRLMRSQKVYIPFNEMSCWINDSLQCSRPWENSSMKLVVYTDSTQCSTCTLRHMCHWDDFVKLEEKYNNRFQLVFIMETRSGTTKNLVSSFYMTTLNHPMYIDSTGVFIKKNPHIPSEQMFHVFLLDENNDVVLVGNPEFNPKIEKMLLAILEEKLAKS